MSILHTELVRGYIGYCAIKEQRTILVTPRYLGITFHLQFCLDGFLSGQAVCIWSKKNLPPNPEDRSHSPRKALNSLSLGLMLGIHVGASEGFSWVLTKDSNARYWNCPVRCRGASYPCHTEGVGLCTWDASTERPRKEEWSWLPGKPFTPSCGLQTI